MSFRLNHFKDERIHNASVLYSLGEFAITNFIASGLNMGEQKVIYKRIANGEHYFKWAEHIYHTKHGIWKTIGFGDNMQDALDKLNRMITGAPIYIRSTNRRLCPHCGKIEDTHTYTKYVWEAERLGNTRSYSKWLGRIYNEAGMEILIGKPSVWETYCTDCIEFDPDGDLPF